MTDVLLTVVHGEYAFGRFKLVPDRQLLCDGTPVALGVKPLKILTTLVTAGGHLVTKDELIESAWPGLFVEENTLQAHISAIRKALGEDGRWIVTVPGQGYRFAGPPPEPLAAIAGGLTSVAPRPLLDDALRSELKRRRLWPTIAALATAAAALAGGWAALHRPSEPGIVREDRYLDLPFV
jgi:DNA-binding winged helix-turn-helix (wHTH) protein